MKQNVLLSYAYLKVNFDKSNTSPLELMLPFSIRALATIDTAVISAPDLQTTIARIWGLNIPQNVIRFMFPKLEKMGYLTRDSNAYKIVKNIGASAEFEEIETRAKQIYERVKSGIQRLIVIHEVNGVISPDEVIERFLDTGGTAFLTTRPRIPYTDPLDVQSNVMIAEFIGLDGSLHTKANFEDILSLVIGDVLYKAIATLSESDTEVLGGGKMQAVEVYLDTPVIMRLLRYEDDDLRRPIKEMASLALATGCKLRVFTHTVEEVQNILRGAADTAYTKRQKSSLDERIIARGISRSDLIEDAQFLPEILSEMNVEIVDPPPITRELSVAERELDVHLQSRIGYKNPDAKIRDIASLTAIFRSRNGLIKKSLESCQAILITTNINLAAASTDFFAKHFSREGLTNVVQHCMTDVIFTMRMWLKVPTKFVDVPRNQIIAHSLSTLRPNDALYDAFVKQLDRLVSDGSITEDVRIRARLAALVTPTLMIETQGQINSLNEGSTSRIVSDILAREEAAKASVATAARLEERSRAAMSAQKAAQQHAAEMKEVSDQAERERRAARQIQEKLDRSERHRASIVASRDKIANFVARFVSRLITYLSLLALVTLTMLVFLDGFGQNPLAIYVKKRIGETGSHTALGFLSLILAALAFKGISYVDLAKRGEEIVRKYVLALSKKYLDID